MFEEDKKGVRPEIHRVGHEYRDLTKRVPEDEFMNWLDTDGNKNVLGA